MSVLIIIVECLVLSALISLMVVIMLNKNPVSMIANYPPEIQAEYYKSQGLEAQKEKLTAKNYIVKVIFMIAALALTTGFAYLAGARTFADGFIAAICYAFSIFAVDTFIIDWIFFTTVKRWRLPGTEHMDKEYSQKWFHIKDCLPMVPVFLVFAVLEGLIIMLI